MLILGAPRYFGYIFNSMIFQLVLDNLQKYKRIETNINYELLRNIKNDYLCVYVTSTWI